MQTAVEAKRKRSNLLPPKPKRQVGHRKPMWGMRPPEALEKYVLHLEATRNYERNALLVSMLEAQRELRLALGDDWWEIEKIAAVEGVTPGSVLARMVRAGLKKK